jgi:hypothetical protein
MLGYVAETTQNAADTFFPGYAKAMTDVGKERGWPPMTRAQLRRATRSERCAVGRQRR